MAGVKLSNLGDLLKQSRGATIAAQLATNTGSPGPIQAGQNTGAAAAAISPGSPQFTGINYNLYPEQLKPAEIAIHLQNIVDSINKSGVLPEMFEMFMFRFAFLQKPRAKGVFHPSELARETSLCRRKMYYQKAGVPKDVTFINFTDDNRMMRLVDLGTMVHLYMQENQDRANRLIAYEVPVVSAEYGISGSADAIVSFSGVDYSGTYYPEEDMVEEIKTMNDYQFSQLQRPVAEHIKQASIYAYLLKYDKIVFIYYNKNTSETKTFVTPVDVKYVEDFLHVAGGIVKLYEQNGRDSGSTDPQKHVIPARVCSARTCDRAMACPHATYCFKSTN